MARVLINRHHAQSLTRDLTPSSEFNPFRARRGKRAGPCQTDHIRISHPRPQHAPRRSGLPSSSSDYIGQYILARLFIVGDMPALPPRSLDHVASAVN